MNEFDIVGCVILQQILDNQQLTLHNNAHDIEITAHKMKYCHLENLYLKLGSGNSLVGCNYCWNCYRWIIQKRPGSLNMVYIHHVVIKNSEC